MFRNWTFGKRLGIKYLFSACVLLSVTALGYFSTSRLIDNNRRVAHTYQVQRDLGDLLSQLTDAETGQRGFVITGKEDYLGPYVTALSQIRSTFDHIRTVTSDNPDQQRRLDQLRPLIDEKLVQLAKSIEMRRKDGLQVTADYISKDAGKSTMDSIRRIVAEMDKQEADLLEARTAEAESTAVLTRTILLGGCVGGIVLNGLFASYIITTLGGQISSAVSRVQSSTGELQAAAGQQTTTAREQSAAMAEIATTIKELVATARQIADSAQRVARNANETANGARGGDQALRRTQDAVAGIRNQVDTIVTHMLELGRKSQRVGSILEVVNELAEQTNILAINASIEAAGAGDSGRRFGVVAEEIRKLADRVTGSTKDIRALIEEMRSAVHSTVMATEAGAKSVEDGTRQFSGVSAAFQEIVRLVDTTTEASREIELSTKQQATAVEQVNEAITSIAQAAKESEVSSAQTLLAVTELNSLSRDIARIVKHQTTARS